MPRRIRRLVLVLVARRRDEHEEFVTFGVADAVGRLEFRLRLTPRP